MQDIKEKSLDEKLLLQIIINPNSNGRLRIILFKKVEQL